ncbi:MAG: protein kinase domain-containing protein [Gemmataceae bacterium]
MQPTKKDSGPNTFEYTVPSPPTRRIDSYEIVRPLGEGGMGIVYLCNDTKLRRPVALKMLKVGPGSHSDDLHRFRQEAEALSNFQHPNIVQVFDLGMHEGQPFLVMEYLEGGNLASRLAGRPIPPHVAAGLIETLARAVQAAHDEKIVHRDLKPGNILLVEKSDVDLEFCTPKISDFGLAKRLMDNSGRTVTGIIMGTPEYMAPEQASGKAKDVGPGADVYALGAMLYECLTGRPPFRGATSLETLEQVRSAEPASPSRLVPRLPGDLCTIALKCLNKEPGRRYYTAGELADDLRRYLDGQPIKARPVGSFEKLLRSIRRRPVHFALGASSLLLALVMALLAWQWQIYSYREQINEMEKSAAEREKEFNQKQHEKSVAMLRNILDKLIGPLNAQPNLEPLREAMLVHFQNLVADQERQGLGSTQLAGSCLDLGRLLLNTGDPRRAQDSLRRAEALYRDQKNPYEQARVLLELARCQRILGEPAKTKEECEKARAILESLPQTAKNREVLGDTWQLLGEAAMDLNENQLAEKSFTQGKILFRELWKADAVFGLQRKLARSHGYLGDVFLDMGNPQAADHEYWESHVLRLQLGDPNRKVDPEELAQDLMQLGRSWGNFGNMQTRFRTHRTAIDFFQSAKKYQDKLVEDHPKVTDFLTDAAETCNRIAELQLLDLPESADRARDREEIQKLLDLGKQRLENCKYDVVRVQLCLVENLSLRARLLSEEKKYISSETV